MDARLLLLLMSASAVFAISNWPKCLDADVTKVTGYWGNNGGAPKDILKSKDTFKVLKGTNSKVAPHEKCKNFNFVDGKQLHIKEDNLTLNATESAGRITAQDTTLYAIVFGKGILLIYRCSADGTAVGADNLADVTLSAKAGTNTADITAADNVAKGLGFTLTDFACKT